MGINGFFCKLQPDNSVCRQPDDGLRILDIQIRAALFDAVLECPVGLAVSSQSPVQFMVRYVPGLTGLIAQMFAEGPKNKSASYDAGGSAIAREDMLFVHIGIVTSIHVR